MKTFFFNVDVVSVRLNEPAKMPLKVFYVHIPMLMCSSFLISFSAKISLRSSPGIVTSLVLMGISNLTWLWWVFLWRAHASAWLFNLNLKSIFTCGGGGESLMCSDSCVPSSSLDSESESTCIFQTKHQLSICVDTFLFLLVRNVPFTQCVLHGVCVLHLAVWALNIFQ